MKVRIVKRETRDQTILSRAVIQPSQKQSDRKLAQKIESWIGELREQKRKARVAAFEMLHDNAPFLSGVPEGRSVLS